MFHFFAFWLNFIYDSLVRHNEEFFSLFGKETKTIIINKISVCVCVCVRRTTRKDHHES